MKINRRRKAQIKALAQRTAPVSMKEFAAATRALIDKHKPGTIKLVTVNVTAQSWLDKKEIVFGDFYISCTGLPVVSAKSPQQAIDKMRDNLERSEANKLAPSDAIVEL